MNTRPPLDKEQDPITQFGVWLQMAEQTEPNDPNAMNLATCAADGRLSSRMVLLKDFDVQGFVFYTNRESQKGCAVQENPRVALCFHWKSLRAQVRVEGSVTDVTDEEADAYFATRPRDSQIGAWASQQSRPLAGRSELKKSIAVCTARFGLNPVPRPPYWGGFRVCPTYIEFWRDRSFRLHDRLVYRRLTVDEPWEVTRLYP